MAAGFVDLGENYAQEMLTKVDLVPGARWHFVGRLQSNKVRLLAGHVHLWQSIDRRSLVSELARRDPGAKVLIQVDLAGTEGRGGVQRGDVGALLAFARDCGLEVSGLMGVAAPQADAAQEAFSWLAATAAELGLQEVSMGMSGDLEDALRAGATMVRIGTALLGPRRG
ncbi:MAG: alanine racemase [Microthrixaceae bacterium]|nr:alanine racemase [Microthrixaceae bacterium]